MLITIQDSNLSAIIDSVGAQLISLKDNEGIEYIWQRDPKFWSRSSPLLFPIVGNCRKDRTVIEGITYHIPKHGFCREMDFLVTDQTNLSATFEIRDNEMTKQVYPYSFVLSLSYRIDNGSLVMEYQVTNSDSRIISYCLGAHPGFNCPLKENEFFEDYQIVFEKKEHTSSMIYDLNNMQFDPSMRGYCLENEAEISLNRELFKDDAIYFDQIESRKAMLVHKNSGHGVSVAFPGFETIAFWSPYPQKAPFLCFEPWNGSGIYATEDDEFNHKNHLQTLAVGEIKHHQMKINILKGNV